MKFPTNGEILQRYLYIKDQCCHTEKPRNIAVKIYHEIENIYSKVPCSMKKKSFCLDKICILYKEWQILNGQRKSSKNRTEKFQKELKNTCNLVGKNAIHEIKTDKCRDDKRKHEDISFLKD